jgi:hypothetical protein
VETQFWGAWLGICWAQGFLHLAVMRHPTKNRTSHALLLSLEIHLEC